MSAAGRFGAVNSLSRRLRRFVEGSSDCKSRYGHAQPGCVPVVSSGKRDCDLLVLAAPLLAVVLQRAIANPLQGSQNRPAAANGRVVTDFRQLWWTFAPSSGKHFRI